MTDQSIYLARHGETAFNADGRLRGLADPQRRRSDAGPCDQPKTDVIAQWAPSTRHRG
jgi:broad specificity phosphatase PhoE